MFQVHYCGSYYRKWVQNIVGQIEKQIEVIKTFIILMKKRSFRKCNIQNRALLFDEKQIQNIIKESNSNSYRI
jgi:acetolactate synthase-1/3 small subunit